MNTESRLSPVTLLTWISLTLIVTGFVIASISLLDGGLTFQNLGLMLGLGEIIGGIFIIVMGAYLQLALNITTKRNL